MRVTGMIIEEEVEEADEVAVGVVSNISYEKAIVYQKYNYPDLRRCQYEKCLK